MTSPSTTEYIVVLRGPIRGTIPDYVSRSYADAYDELMHRQTMLRLQGWTLERSYDDGTAERLEGRAVLRLFLSPDGAARATLVLRPQSRA